MANIQPLQQNTPESERRDPWEIRQAAEQRRRLIASAGLTERECSIGFDGYRAVNDSQANAKKAVQDIVTTGNGNLYLHGESGVGKTHLGLSLVNCHLGKTSVRFAPISRFLMEVRRASMETSEIEQIEKAASVRFFVLDDFGTQKVTDWSLMFMDCLVDEWYRIGKQGLVITSNFPLGRIAEQISDRIASRIAGMCQIMQIEGVDHRIGERRRP